MTTTRNEILELLPQFADLIERCGTTASSNPEVTKLQQELESHFSVLAMYLKKLNGYQTASEKEKSLVSRALIPFVDFVQEKRPYFRLLVGKIRT